MSRLHDMTMLLRECGEDASCACGCSKPKAKEKEKKSEASEVVLQALSEARKKIGLRRFRNIKKARKLRNGRATKIKNVQKMYTAVRGGAAYNRHR